MYTVYILHLHFIHLADAFIQSVLQRMTIEAIKTNKRATTCKRYDKSRLAERSTCSKFYFLNKQVDKKKLVLVFQEKLEVRE